MIPFDHEIKSMDDVRKAYPQSFDLCFLNRKEVKKFIQNELKDMVTDAKDEAQFYGERPKPTSLLNKTFLPIAQAKALYHFLWSIDHLTNQMVKYGRKPNEIVNFIRGMEAAGYDPYSTEEDTACNYIDAVNHRGYKLVILPNGKEFKAYNPIKCGYASDTKARH